MKITRTGLAVAGLLAVFAADRVGAFGFSGSSGGGATKAYVDQQVADIWAGMPQPAITTPMTDAAAGAIGSTTSRFMLADAVRPARYRSGQCTISGGAGACTITWSSPFSATPNALGDPSALNTSPGTTQYNCNWTSLTATGGAVVCRSSVLGIAVLGTILSFLANGVVVTGNAVQPL